MPFPGFLIYVNFCKVVQFTWWTNCLGFQSMSLCLFKSSVTSPTAQTTDRWTYCLRIVNKNLADQAGDRTRFRKDYHRTSIVASVWYTGCSKSLQPPFYLFSVKRKKIRFRILVLHGFYLSLIGDVLRRMQ